MSAYSRITLASSKQEQSSASHDEDHVGNDDDFRSHDNISSHDDHDDVPIESSSMEKPISKGIGFKLLQKMGWKENTGINIIEPILVHSKNDKLGIGREEEIDKLTDPSNFKRKLMHGEVEELVGISEEVQRKRDESAVKSENFHIEKQAVLKSFYCSTCDKQYANVDQMSKHLSSYDHHHRARMESLKKASSGEEAMEQKKRREQEKEDKEFAMLLKKSAAAAPPPPPPASEESSVSSDSVLQVENRPALKFGFGISSSSAASKSGPGRPAATIKPRPALPSVIAKPSVFSINRADSEIDEGNNKRKKLS